jgi:biopolymer transport protein TolR
VTPLVDVMLVLLIVFMVAAPLMTAGIPVDLPKTQAKQLNDQKPPIVVSVDANGGFFVDKREVSADGLLAALNEDSENSKDRRIHVRADKTVPYGRVVEAMGAINAAGYAKVALVSEAPSGGGASKQSAQTTR